LARARRSTPGCPLRGRCSQLEEQVEQQQKVIRYLQSQQQHARGHEHLEQLQDENEELRQEIRNLKQRVGFLEAILQNEFNFAPAVKSHPCVFASTE
jgi:cell division protein FtsB